jgi:hypothetical protein
MYYRIVIFDENGTITGQLKQVRGVTDNLKKILKVFNSLTSLEENARVELSYGDSAGETVFYAKDLFGNIQNII